MVALVIMLHLKRFFWAKLVSKLNILQIQWKLTKDYIVISWLQFWYLSFFKDFAIHFLDVNLVPKTGILQIKHRGTLLYAAYDFDIHFSIFFFYSFFRKILPQNLVLSKSTEILYRGILLHADYDFFRQILLEVLMFSELIEICQRTYCYMLIILIYNP